LPSLVEESGELAALQLSDSTISSVEVDDGEGAIKTGEEEPATTTPSPTNAGKVGRGRAVNWMSGASIK